MLGMLATMGRLLRDHWPALLAWYLAGTIARYVVIEASGFVGAYNDIGGAMILPLAPLVQLVSYVAMLLTLRDGLRQLRAVRIGDEDGRWHTRFGRALIDGIVPYVALYTAYSYLDEDRRSFALRALDRRAEVGASAIADGAPDAPTADFVIGTVLLTPLSVAIVVLAFAARWWLGRERLRDIRWLAPLAVYLEALWVVFTFMMLLEVKDIFFSWVGTRTAYVWFQDARDWLSETFAPVLWIWDGIAWLIEQGGTVILLPLAWLAVVGAIYRIALAADLPELPGRRLARVRTTRVGREVAEATESRLEPVLYALRLVWGAGPVLIGSFLVLFALLELLDPLLTFGLTRLIGPQDFDEFWMAIGNAVLVVPDLILGPVMVALLAAAYDATLARMAPEVAAVPVTRP